MGPRVKYTGIIRDDAGNVYPSVIVFVYLSGTTTVATIYDAVDAVSPAGNITTNTSGQYTFYVDLFDYDYTQRFKIYMPASINTSQRTVTYDSAWSSDIVEGAYAVSADKTVSTYVRVPKGVTFAVATGKTLTFSGGFEAGLYQVFSGAGTVAFGDGAVEASYPEWWGPNTTPGTTDMTAEIQAAITAYPTVQFQDTVYAFTTLELSNYTVLKGKSWSTWLTDTFATADWVDISNFDGTVLLCTSTTLNGITFGTASHRTGIHIKDLAIVGPGSGTTVGINASVDGGATYYIAYCNDFLNNVLVANFAKGILMDNLISWSASSLTVRGCTTGIDVGNTTASTDGQIYRLDLQGCTTGIKYQRCNMFHIFGGLIQSNTTGISLATASSGVVKQLAFDGVWFESNTASWAYSGGTYGASDISFINCREATNWTWTIADGDVLNNFGFNNCYFSGITIDFSGYSTGGYSWNWNLQNCLFNDISGIPSTYTKYFSGSSVVLTTPDINVELKGNANKWRYSTAAPTTGSWGVGDVTWRTNPVATEYLGWVCTEAGTPGIWKGFGTVET